MKNKKNGKYKEPVNDVSSVPSGEFPEDVFELINRYGTYNIQATADTDNLYPAIAQGFNEEIIDTDCQNRTSENPEY